MTPLTIRIAAPSDVNALATLYHQTVIAHGTKYYTPAQASVWAASALNRERFQRLVLKPTTYVAEWQGEILGFAGIEDDGHVASLYVHRDRLRQGIGSALMAQILHHADDAGLARLFGEASEFSLGLFQKFGFAQYDTESVDLDGVQFTRYLVERYPTRK